MNSQRKLLIYSAVQHSTEEGHESLKIGDLKEASKHFSNALEKAELYRDEFLIRACSFNLGSCLVACGQPSKGIEYLEKAAPPSGDTDGLQNYADLEYNIGIARHALGSFENAIDSYVKASKAYKDLDDLSMQVEAHSKLAICHQSLKNQKEAASSFKIVAELYEQLNEHENRAIALSSLTTLLAELEDIEECSKNLKILLGLCQEIDNSKLKGKIYHDVGMLYSSEKCYKSAYECFEQSYHALQDVPIESKDKTLEAVVLLNMGASLNQISLFERALIFHQMAADKFGELGDLKSQSQVFCNLAFAYSQTENYEEARTSFTQAIQCSKDSNDTIGQCLATECLAAIYFRQQQYQDAIENYKDALALVAKTGEENKVHSDRIVNKLAQAVEYQFKVNENKSTMSRLDVIDSGKAKGNRIGRRRRTKPKYGKVNSLVAKGLEETSEEEEQSASSFYDSESSSSKNQSSSTETEAKNDSKSDATRRLRGSQRTRKVNRESSSSISRDGSKNVGVEELPGIREGYRESSGVREGYRESSGVGEGYRESSGIGEGYQRSSELREPGANSGRYHATYSSPLLENSMTQLPSKNGDVTHLDLEEKQGRTDIERKIGTSKSHSKVCVIQ